MSYRWPILTFLIFSGISTSMVLYTRNIESSAVMETSLLNAKLYSDAIVAVRTVYTSEVVAKAESFGMEISHDHVGEETIPLPATLSMLLGEELGASGSGASASLYSPYPFPWREQVGGLKDVFSEAAWTQLSVNPAVPYFQFVQTNDRSELRYAVADIMRAACIDCHNTHPDSPRSGWMIGDVRGVLEVTIPTGAFMSTLSADLNITIVIYAFLSLLGMVGIYLIKRTHDSEAQSLQEKNAKLIQAINEVKTLRGIIPICSYCHEIRNDEGAWNRLEAYISHHSEAQFSHGICPNCTLKAKNDIEAEMKPYAEKRED